MDVPAYKWAKMVKELDNNKCAFCGSVDKLEAHHIRGKAEFPSLKNDLDNGIALCHVHHYMAHGGDYANSGLKLSNWPKVKSPANEVRAFVKEYAETHLAVAVDNYAEVKAHAEAQNESVNGFISRAIDETMQRDKEQQP